MRTLDALLGALGWLLLLVGMLTRDPWTFATAAFFIIHRTLDGPR